MLQLKLTTLSLLLLLAFLACSEKKDNRRVIFPIPPKETLDSVGTFLLNPDNYATDAYLPFFDTHFNQQITRNNIDSAARLLALAGYQACASPSFDSVWFQKQTDFLSKYAAQIKPYVLATIHNNLGYMLFANAEFEKSIIYFRKNRNMVPKDYHTDTSMGSTYDYMMRNFAFTAQYDSAILYGQKAMLVFENYEDTIGQYNVFYYLGGAYRYMEQYEESEKYLDKGLKIASVVRDSQRIFDCMNEKANMYEEIKSDLLYAYLDTAIKFEKKWQPKEPNYSFVLQSALAMRYFRDSNYLEAEKILKALAPFYPLVYENQQDRYNKLLADYENMRHKPLSLRKTYLNRLERARTSRNFMSISNYSDILKTEAVGLKDYKNAYEYSEEDREAQDSLSSVQLVRTAVELDKKYQIEKKEAQLKLQAEEALVKNIFIAVLLGGFAALFYFYYTVKKQKNIIAQQNELNEQTIAVLSHDIKEPLLGVKLLLKKLNKDDPFIAQASQSLTDQINAVNGILTNLLKMKKLGLTKRDKNAQADVSTVVQNVVRELSVAIEAKELTIHIELSDTMRLPIAPEKLQIIVHNLLSNAVKYSFPQQQIRITKESNGFAIQDFGVGLSPEQRSKLMREVTASERGTTQERGNGLGLFLVGTLLHGEQIKVVFDSPEVGGTIAKILA